MEQPLVSVVIPFYSELEWLKEALNSVQNQTYKNIEVIVINDGSEVDFSTINYIYSDLDIKIIYKENGGPSSARNLGIDMSTGKYIAFLDSDDLWLPSKLEKQVSFMEKENYVWSQHSYKMFWENKEKTKIIDTSIYNGDVYKDCFISFKVQTSCVVVLKKILTQNNIYFPLDKRYGQDVDFYKKIAKKYPLGFVNEVLSKFRVRGTNAGFRAQVQLADRALTWKENNKNGLIRNILPKPVIFAYKLCSLFDKTLKFIQNKITKNEKSIEFFARCLYLLPYILFKSYSKRK